MNRLIELLHKEKQFLQDGEVLIYIKDGNVIAQINDGESLSEVSCLYFWDVEREEFTEINKAFVDSDGDLTLSF